ncbi:uncharacterized protein Nmag_0109 [Natrialba magadii ATCC 43099]|uniref:Uncharacterized protein n=1 Tax=Natrialba magadii (strain ATCC 43099 / DSM 3394 / CCM 3739 / CIP 104546 / IAM 13178 / JCM 8861 / NBRC 102185 / NCIMB 2190 / MS3) TaxID=547559 RepID=D3SWB5_NATMM|nr:uncharacterized protein Nmag_0109 [Natrialba magadii ATCC 43099]ELY33763.1 hypothetical protein C500_01018 [Natrialba magadii ATCC 43099]
MKKQQAITESEQPTSTEEDGGLLARLKSIVKSE